MPQTYCRDDPVSGRWSGVNRLLTEYEVDDNFYTLIQRVATLEAGAHTTVSIDTITLSGNEITIHMTDSTTRGPFAIPIATFRDRGTWAALTSYLVNDTFNIDGTVYVTIFAHVSAATFDAGANDGMGHNYYSPLLTQPGNSLPTGGAAGMMLAKVDGHDFHVTWSYPVPVGGSTGQFLTKASGTDFDMSWSLGYSVPAGGDAGQKLVKHSGSDGDTQWKDDTLALLTDVLIGSPLSAGDVFQWDGAQYTNKPAIGRQTIWVPGSAMTPNTTNGSASGSFETTTNKVMVTTQDFSAITQQFAQFTVTMPRSWDGGAIYFVPVWSHPATTVNFGVVFGLDAVAILDAAALDAAFGTAQTSTDVGGTTDDNYAGPESTAITVGGSPAGGALVVFRVHRDPASGSDNLAVNARLLGVQIIYRTAAMTDD